MQRYKLVLGGTIAGIAGLLAFSTKGADTTASSIGSSASSSPTTSAPSAAVGTSGSSPTAASPTTSTDPSPATTTPPTTRSATSVDEAFRYGDLAVTVTVNGSKITNVTMATLNETDGRSQQIDQYAIPELEREVISADSANISAISGATFTSQAFADGLSNALQKLGFQ